MSLQESAPTRPLQPCDARAVPRRRACADYQGPVPVMMTPVKGRSRRPVEPASTPSGGPRRAQAGRQAQRDEQHRKGKQTGDQIDFVK